MRRLRIELISKISFPNTRTTATRARRITRLDHKPLDNTMKRMSIVVPVLGVRGEVLHGFGGKVGVELEEDVAEGCAKDGGGAEFFNRLCGELFFAGWFLVENIACGGS